jgi:hypothetical protein
MDQRNLTFIPHILPVLAGTTVHFPYSPCRGPRNSTWAAMEPGKRKRCCLISLAWWNFVATCMLKWPPILWG